MIEFRADQAVKEIGDTVGNLGSYQSRLAMVRALNRAAKMARTEGSKELRKVYNRKHAGVLTDTFIHNATQNNMTAYVKPSSLRKRINMSSAKGATDYRVKQGAEGVYLQIKKGKTELIKGAFIQEMKSGHKGVFSRGKYKSKDYQTFIPSGRRYPITELTTISTYKQMIESGVLEKVNKKAQAAFTARYIHEANRILNKEKL